MATANKDIFKAKVLMVPKSGIATPSPGRRSAGFEIFQPIKESCLSAVTFTDTVKAARKVGSRTVLGRKSRKIMQQRRCAIIARCVAPGDLAFDLRPDRFPSLDQRIEASPSFPFGLGPPASLLFLAPLGRRTLARLANDFRARQQFGDSALSGTGFLTPRASPQLRPHSGIALRNAQQIVGLLGLRERGYRLASGAPRKRMRGIVGLFRSGLDQVAVDIKKSGGRIERAGQRAETGKRLLLIRQAAGQSPEIRNTGTRSPVFPVLSNDRMIDSGRLQRLKRLVQRHTAVDRPPLTGVTEIGNVKPVGTDIFEPHKR